jgi:hypothetical protein
VRVAGCMVALICGLGMAPAALASPADPYCTGTYGGAPARAAGPLRFGIDPGVAGSAGGLQLPSVPDDPAKDLAAVQALDPPGRIMVVRLNRLFWSDGQAGIDAFKAQAGLYTRAGFEVRSRSATTRPRARRETWPPGWLTCVT